MDTKYNYVTNLTIFVMETTNGTQFSFKNYSQAQNLHVSLISYNSFKYMLDIPEYQCAKIEEFEIKKKSCYTKGERQLMQRRMLGKPL